MLLTLILFSLKVTSGAGSETRNDCKWEKIITYKENKVRQFQILSTFILPSVIGISGAGIKDKIITNWKKLKHKKKTKYCNLTHR